MENKETIKSVTFIIAGALLQIFNGVGGGWAAPVVSIFGLILFFIGLKKLKDGLDPAGQRAVSMLIIAAIVGFVGLIIDLIPLVGWLAIIILMLAFIIELVGFLRLKASETIGDKGKSGAGLLVISMVLVVIAALFWFIPVVGGIISSILSLAALFLVFYGWQRIQSGIIGDKVPVITSITLILTGTLLLLCNTATSGWAPAIAAIFGLYLVFKGYKQLHDHVDAIGQSAVKLLVISIIIGIAASAMDFVASLISIGSGDVTGLITSDPGVFDYIISIAFVTVFVVQFIGFLKLKGSTSIGEAGKTGVVFLLVSMIVAVVASIIEMVPFSGVITPVFAIIGLILIFFGWLKVQDGLIKESSASDK